MRGRRIKKLSAWLHHSVAFDPTHDQHAAGGQKGCGMIETCHRHRSGGNDAARGSAHGVNAGLQATCAQQKRPGYHTHDSQIHFASPPSTWDI
jgi:hypothetical protein